MADIEYALSVSGKQERILVCGPSREYPWHFHLEHWIMGEVCSGTVRLETVHGEFRLQKGDCCSIPPFTPHRLSVATGSVFGAAAFRFDVTACTVYGIGIPSHDQEPTYSGSSSCILKKRVHAESLPATAMEMRQGTLGPLLRKLVERPEEEFGVDRMALETGYSRWHFTRVFHAKTGMTPHAFQLVCRLSRVRRLLRSGLGSAEAALCSGFADQSHMHKVFKLHHGLTPGQFLRASVSLP